MSEGNGEGAGTREFSADVIEMGDKLSQLTIARAQELTDYMKDKYNIEPAGGAAVVMPVGPTAEVEPEEEKTDFSVILEEFGAEKIKVIKVVREITGLGLKEAKEVVEGAPKAIKENVPKEEAEKYKQQLEDVGAKVSLK